MKFLFVLLTAFTFSGTAFSQANTSTNKLLRHVVIFKFKESSTPDDVKKVSETFAALYGKVPQVKAFEWVNKIVTVCFYPCNIATSLAEITME